MLNILLVEDDWADAFLTLEAFAGHQDACVIERVEDGREALEYLERTARCVDIVLLDLNLPGLDGLGVWRAVQERGLRCFVIALLGSELDTTRWESRGMKPHAFLIKPVDPQQVFDVWRAFRSG